MGRNEGRKAAEKRRWNGNMRDRERERKKPNVKAK